MNQTELSVEVLNLPELSDIRQQQLDWCLSRVSWLELPYDCLARRLNANEKVAGSELLTTRVQLPLANFECQLQSTSADTFSVWAEYWEQIIQAAIQSACDFVVRSSNTIVGLVQSQGSAKVKIHEFILTGTPANSPVALSISATPSLAFKPDSGLDATTAKLKVLPLIEVGRTSVSTETFSHMKVGGLLVLRSRIVDRALTNALICFIDRRYIFSANWNLDEGTIFVTNKKEQDENNEDGKMNLAKEGGIAVPIFAHIELRSVEIDDLKKLKQEDVLQTDFFPKDVVVKLSAGGITFGEGQLVQIEGRLAVRIIKLSHRG